MYQNKRYTKLYTEKGITLVALVVTIIILLVLAGITVASLTGENGLIGKSGEAKKQAEISEGLEQLEIAVTQSTNKRGNIDTTRLAKNLSKINGLKYINDEKQEIGVTENTEIKLTAKVKLKGNTFKINDEGNVSYKKEGAIDNEDVINSPETYYGHYVTNYNSPNDAGIVDVNGQLGKWQIFLADDTNIYLIASNNITTTPTVTNNTDIPEILSRLDKQNIYHKWMNTPLNQTKNQNNKTRVAYMLDIETWSDYNNTTYAKYAIGGSSIEMFCKAYNDSHTGNKLEAIENIEGACGYKIKKGSEEPANGVSGLKTGAKNTLVDNMYFKAYSQGTGYWCASPASGASNHVISIRNGSISSIWTGTTTESYRPLVCLKSNVHIVLNEDGQTYSLELD